MEVKLPKNGLLITSMVSGLLTTIRDLSDPNPESAVNNHYKKGHHHLAEGLRIDFTPRDLELVLFFFFLYIMAADSFFDP